MKIRTKRAVLWGLLGVVVILVALVVGFYVWFHNQVGASNARLDPAIVEALKEKPPSTTATPATAPPTTAVPTSEPAGTTTTAGNTSSSAAPTTTSSESTTTTAPFEVPSGMNIVLVGGDKRSAGSSEVTEGRSDTIILVHIDPEKNFLSLLSVPRDLRAQVKGYGHRKINAAYAYGGGALLIRTIQSELGVDLDHYIGVDFQSFKAITDALGGVYVDVDREYDDGKIELQPGYQLLDGLNALRFVRTRHDGNIDFGRMERQQRFLSAVREQVMTWNLPFKLPSLVKALFSNVDTDLSANEVIKLAYWVMKLDGSAIKRAEIIGPTGMINGSSYVLPSQQQLAASVKDFFTPPPAGAGSDPAPSSGSSSEEPPAPATLSPVDLARISVDVVNASGRVGQGAFAAVWLQRRGATLVDIREAEEIVTGVGSVRYPAGRSEAAQSVAQALGIGQVEQSRAVARVTAVLGDAYGITANQVAAATGSVERLATWQSLQKEAGFPLLAPSYLPSTLRYSFARNYEVKTGGDGHPAVRVGYRYKGKDLYLGASATTWLDAPLASPGAEVPGDGVVYTAVGTSNKTDHVWWIKDDVLFWVSNTLFAELTREELLAIAVSSVPVSAAE